MQDIRLPGMVFGRVVRPPSPGAKLESLDESAAKRVPGVVAVVRDGNFVAVAAEREEQAIKAAQALRASAKWNETADLPPPAPELFEHLQKMRSQDSVINQKIPAAPAGGRITTYEATYRRPYQAHASMGPSCTVAQVKDGKYRIWTHSQGVFPLRRELTKVLGVPEADITCTHVEGAGCYGHNGADDVALDAILVARATGGRPVKLQWMRDDEFSWEPYGSAMVMKMRARLDESGSIVDWRHEVWSHPHSTRPISNPGCNLLAGWHLAKPVAAAPSPNIPQPTGGADRNAVPTYDFPSQQILLHYITDIPIRTSALRTLGAYANVFALESFMDEAAAAAGIFDMYGPDARASDDALTRALTTDRGHCPNRMMLYRAAYAIATANASSAGGDDGHFAWCASQLQAADLAVAHLAIGDISGHNSLHKCKIGALLWPYLVGEYSHGSIRSKYCKSDMSDIISVIIVSTSAGGSFRSPSRASASTVK